MFLRIMRIKYYFFLTLITIFSACTELEENYHPSYDMTNISISEVNNFQYASFQTLDFERVWKDYYTLPKSPDFSQIKINASYSQAYFDDANDFFEKQSRGISLIYEEEGHVYHKLYLYERTDSRTRRISLPVRET